MKVSVVRDDGGEVRKAVELFHYLHRWPDPRSLPFAYRLIVDGRFAARDGRPNGVVVFKKPQHQKQGSLFGYDGLPTAWQVLDMARVWVHPQWQRRENGHALCMFTRMVSRCLRRVRADWLEHHPPRYPERPYHIELVLSYCELAHHDGTAYRAASFEPIGITSDDKKEIYLRRLKPPKKSWRLSSYNGAVQLPLLGETPLKYF